MLPLRDVTHPLRIAYIVKRFPKLSETFVLNEILELERQGVQVEVISLKRPEAEPKHADLLRNLRARVHYLDDMPGSSDALPCCSKLHEDLLLGKSPEAIRELKRKAMHAATLARALGCQHLHAHFGNDSTLIAAMAGQATDIPMSFTAHAKDIYHTYTTEEIDRRVRRAKIASARFVVTVTNANKEHLGTLAAPNAADNIFRIYNGIDLSRFSFNATPVRENGLLLAVGRLVEKKGYRDLVQAIALCQKRLPRIRLLICGDGPLRDQIEADIAHHGLEECVFLLGSVEQGHVLELMQRASALVLPSLIAESGDRDALPTVLLEAQASGLPVISTDISGIPEIITHDVDGLLVPQRDPPGLASAIERILRDQSLAHRLARAGRENVMRKFNIERSVERLRKLFMMSAAQTTLFPINAAAAEPAVYSYR